jgi:predicted Zn-dependent protease
VLAAAGFDPYGMPDFFETMGRRTSISANSRDALPEILQSHPVTTNRIAESRARAAQFKDLKPTPETVSYALTRERLRVLGSPPEDNVRGYYSARREQQPIPTPGELYGEALASLQAGNARASLDSLVALARDYPQVPMLHATLGSAYMAAGDSESALATFRGALAISPRNIPLTLRYAEALLKVNDAKTAHAVLLDLFNNVAPTPEQIRFTALAASSAGDTGDAAYYMSEYHIATGNLPLSVAQLEMALAAPNITGVQRSRFQARLDEVREAMFSNRRLRREAEQRERQERREQDRQSRRPNRTGTISR